jgi:hypothetical protein
MSQTAPSVPQHLNHQQNPFAGLQQQCSSVHVDENDDVLVHDEPESRPGSRSPHSMGEGQPHGGDGGTAGDVAIDTVAIKRLG